MANFDDDVRQNSDTLSTLVGLFSWTRFLALRIVISVRESPPLTSPVGNSWEQNLMTMKSDNSVESAEVIINSRLLLCQLLLCCYCWQAILTRNNAVVTVLDRLLFPSFIPPLSARTTGELSSQLLWHSRLLFIHSNSCLLASHSRYIVVFLRVVSELSDHHPPFKSRLLWTSRKKERISFSSQLA